MKIIPQIKTPWVVLINYEIIGVKMITKLFAWAIMTIIKVLIGFRRLSGI